jgi:hypothetical protein
MTRLPLRLITPLLALAVTACAGAASTETAPAPSPGAVLELQRGWWHAYTVADTAYLQARTAPEFWLTLSSGRTMDRAGMLAEALTHTSGSQLNVQWAEERVRVAGPAMAVATSRATETVGATSASYRYLTVLQQGDAGWKIALAQSTREAAFTPTVAAGVSGPLADYAGEYRTLRGGVLRVVVRDTALALIEPSGAELPMAPIGPALFEFRTLSPANGVVRFVFTRDASGRVTAFTRLVNGEVITFPRNTP